MQNYREFVDDLMCHSVQDVDGQMLHAVLGVVTEAGELADAVKRSVGYSQPLNMENIKEECGDAIFYITRILSLMGLTLSDAMDDNMYKLNKRYPNGYTDADALSRKDKKYLAAYTHTRRLEMP